MDYKKLELDLLADDISSTIILMERINESPYSRYLTLCVSPLLGFISEESKTYLKKQNMIQTKSIVANSFQSSVAKLRALLKLFDDKDGGRDGLNKTFAIFQRMSERRMALNKNRLQLFLGRYLQPDLGIYFLDGNLFYLTPIAFSALGLTLQEIELLNDKELSEINQKAKSFGCKVGQYIEDTKTILNSKQINTNRYNLNVQPLPLNITHNDFFSKNVYDGVAEKCGLNSRFDAMTMLFVLCQVNIAHNLLPKLFPNDATLLFRIQFLTAYHSFRSLNELKNNKNPLLKNLINKIHSFGSLQNEIKIRNSIAHYGFAGGKIFVTHTKNPLFQLIEGFSCVSISEVKQWVNERLSTISNWGFDNFSKQSFAKYRALLGGHT